jgi:hypothetical protein
MSFFGRAKVCLFFGEKKKMLKKSGVKSNPRPDERVYVKI